MHIADILVARAGCGYARTVETDAIEPHLLTSVHLSESQLEAVGEKLFDLDGMTSTIAEIVR